MNRHLVKGFKNIQPFSKTIPKRSVSYLRGTFSAQTGRSPSLVLRVYCTVVFAIEMGFVWAHLLVLHGGGHMLPGWVFLHGESFPFTSKVGGFFGVHGVFYMELDITCFYSGFSIPFLSWHIFVRVMALFCQTQKPFRFLFHFFRSGPCCMKGVVSR